ncbi:MAG: NAD-dependent DNA ligase LigA [Spirochaetaceae bacterium]|jgi:DNA ligase (NAD+)|nr:NAD-dependent DNA ligase LigA [Spirochaetaceae bacterium]
MDRIEELEKLVKYHQDIYYNGEAEITDAEFDALWDKLRALAPDSPLLKKVGKDTVDGFPKVRHIIPMGSLDKAANEAEFLEWAEKMKPASFLVQHKLDGASLELQYEKGRLVRAVTRGDGITGDEITANAEKMRGVVAKVEPGFSGGIRGEVVMLRSVWRKKYPNKANCRNAANGLMRRKDGGGCENLTVITYDVSAKDGKMFAKEIEKIDWLQKQKFQTVPVREFKTADEVVKFREKEAKKRDSLPYDIDGLVVKDPVTDLDDLKKPRPEKQIAFKFVLAEAVSTLKSVEWSETGATYTPIGIVDPVRLAGTTVQRANLNNPAMICGMGLKIGSRVVIVKRGEIIPKIERLAEENSLLTEEITVPETCGICGSALVNEGTRLYCPNANCPKRLLHRLQKWITVLDILELGDKLICQLFEKRRVIHIPDLYTLEPEELALYDRMGELTAEKVVRNIRAKHTVTLTAFIAGFDFEGIGEILMDMVADAGYDTLDKLRAAGTEELAAVRSIGEDRAQTIKDGLAQTAAEMDEVLKYITISAPRPTGLPLEGVSFCFTGELRTMKRQAAEAKVKELGGTAKSVVVKGLSYLVTNTPESGSSKNKKARELGIPIINEAAFSQMLM